MELEENIMIMAIFNLKENILMEEDGMEKVTIIMEKKYLKSKMVKEKEKNIL